MASCITAILHKRLSKISIDRFLLRFAEPKLPILGKGEISGLNFQFSEELKVSMVASGGVGIILVRLLLREEHRG